MYLSIKFYIYFKIFAIIVFKTDSKPGCLKKLVKTIFLSTKSVIFKSILSLFPLLKIK